MSASACRNSLNSGQGDDLSFTPFHFFNTCLLHVLYKLTFSSTTHLKYLFDVDSLSVFYGFSSIFPSVIFVITDPLSSYLVFSRPDSCFLTHHLFPRIYMHNFFLFIFVERWSHSFTFFPFFGQDLYIWSWWCAFSYAETCNISLTYWSSG